MLDLYNLEMDNLPDQVYSLTSLESLLARHNQLECSPENLCISISPQIAQLTNLTVLDLGYNLLQVVPPAIFDLTHLESLILNNNELEVLDPRIGNLGRTLKTLHLGVNQLKGLPDEIGKLTALNSLIAPTNEIESLPDSMSGLVNLDDIFLRSNQLKSLPKVLLGLPKLSIISIEDNHIKSLPSPSELPSKCQILHSVPQEVAPNLFIGSASSASNDESLQLFKITHHIVLSDPVGEHAPDPAVAEHHFQQHLHITILDTETQSLDETIASCTAFIEKALQDRSHRILVNSTLGVSRSAAIICAYLIKHLHITYDEALSQLRAVRGHVKPNLGFEKQLRAYEKSCAS